MIELISSSALEYTIFESDDGPMDHFPISERESVQVKLCETLSSLEQIEIIQIHLNGSN